MPAVREAVVAVLFNARFHQALQAAVGDGPVPPMPSMLFDKSAVTVRHQGWRYLDSVPDDHLAGAWIAIEDIPEDAGRFLPASVKFGHLFVVRDRVNFTPQGGNAIFPIRPRTRC